MTTPEITVVTLTRGRGPLLRRAITSVRRQDFPGAVEHLVVVDGCPETLRLLRSRRGRSDRPLRWHFAARPPADPGGAARCATLRNLALDLVSGRWVAMLDDDNRYAPDHLSSLWEFARRTGLPAVHSYRYLFWGDGAPFRSRLVPWIPDPGLSRREHDKLVARGVMDRDSHLMRDRCDPIDHPDPLRTIDTSEWLLDAGMARAVRFRTEYTPEEVSSPEGMVCEDGKFLTDLARRRVPIGTTSRPTLDYFLGGYSAPQYGRPAAAGGHA